MSKSGGELGRKFVKAAVAEYAQYEDMGCVKAFPHFHQSKDHLFALPFCANGRIARNKWQEEDRKKD